MKSTINLVIFKLCIQPAQVFCACRSSSGGGGLSSGAKAGIAIGVILAVALAGLGLAFGLARRSRSARGWHKESLDDAFAPDYGRSDTAIEMQRGARLF